MKIIKEKATGKEDLKENEYFALMVTDHDYKERRPKKDYIDFEKGWIGIERTSENKIYISKEADKRTDRMRGDLIIVNIKKEDNVCLLNY